MVDISPWCVAFRLPLPPSSAGVQEVSHVHTIPDADGEAQIRAVRFSCEVYGFRYQPLYGNAQNLGGSEVVLLGYSALNISAEQQWRLGITWLSRLIRQVPQEFARS